MNFAIGTYFGMGGLGGLGWYVNGRGRRRDGKKVDAFYTKILLMFVLHVRVDVITLIVLVTIVAHDIFGAFGDMRGMIFGHKEKST